MFYFRMFCGGMKTIMEDDRIHQIAALHATPGPEVETSGIVQKIETLFGDHQTSATNAFRGENLKCFTTGCINGEASCCCHESLLSSVEDRDCFFHSLSS